MTNDKETKGERMTLYLSAPYMGKIREIGGELEISDTTVVRALVRIGIRAHKDTIVEEIRKYPAYQRWGGKKGEMR